MRISLIGMSGTGKTYWSKKLQETGFIRYSADDLIAEKLKRTGTKDIAEWMGHPFESRYPKTQKIYLDLEEKAMQTIITLIKECKNYSQNIVVDTTGSLIYLKKSTQAQLAKLTTLIYFKVPKGEEEKMYELFLKDHKSIIWGDKFIREKGEDKWQALARCYPGLLKFRAKLYQKLAHTTLDCYLLKSSSGKNYLISSLPKH